MLTGQNVQFTKRTSELSKLSFKIILIVVLANYLRCFLSMAIEGVFNKNMINFLNFCIYICLVEKKVVSLHPNSHACTHFVRFV